MSVIMGASFEDIVILDLDGVDVAAWFVGYVHQRIIRISNRFHLGDCMIILSSYDERLGTMNLHLIFARRLPWWSVHRIITRLAREGILEKKLTALAIDRNHFTTRFTEKRGGDVPFPMGYVQSSLHNSIGIGSWDGISVWLREWNTARKISKEI